MEPDSTDKNHIYLWLSRPFNILDLAFTLRVGKTTRLWLWLRGLIGGGDGGLSVDILIVSGEIGAVIVLFRLRWPACIYTLTCLPLFFRKRVRLFLVMPSRVNMWSGLRNHQK